MTLYWPKIAPGGILAGDDYGQGSYWTECENGTRVEGGVERAVQDFAAREHLWYFVFENQWLLIK